jgi:hypothetical protein
MDERQQLAAIARVRDAVLRDRTQQRDGDLRQLEAIQRVASMVRSHYDEETISLNARIARCLLPVEPFHQAWNVFRLFDVEYEETRWTQWLAAILRHENGPECARVAWRAFCDAVALRIGTAPPSGGANLAGAGDWSHAAAAVPHVEDEVAAGDLGQLDLLFTTPGLVAAVENKLWADWHDGVKAPQADRYRQIAVDRLAGDPVRRLGLILLSQRAGLEAGDYPADYVHVAWRDLGQALRRALRAAWTNDTQTVIALWPIVLTLVSIEQDLLGLAIKPGPTANPCLRLKALAEVAAYLEGT